ncbi:variable surface protein [Plasmodium gonderi]|uniref:Variable surface protein n=1 Tax=Plasmodium gonderi TaxID=77519 RepID=A0A1Y1JW49_PLAGO|nr:variable surface protein [Plasmodium gonderi]GAW84573.1 variable surface protein [Plasmodium gonderi]
MGETMYEFVEKFPEMENRIRGISARSYMNSLSEYSKCIAFNGSHNMEHAKVDEICKKAIPYFSDVLYSTHNNLFKEAYFKYFFYWVYYERSDYKKIRNVINDFYKLLLDIYKHQLPDLNHNNNGTFINVELEELNNIYSVYKCYNNIEFMDGTNRDGVFCKAVLDIPKKYKTQIFTEIKENSTSQIVSYCPNNIAFPIIITILLVFTISFIAFIMYKFTPYRSMFSNGINNIRKKRNNIENEWNVFQLSEISNNVLSDSRYNVLYNSE